MEMWEHFTDGFQMKFPITTARMKLCISITWFRYCIHKVAVRLLQLAECFTASIFFITFTSAGLPATSAGDTPLFMTESWREIIFSRADPGISSLRKMKIVSARYVRKWAHNAWA